MSSSVRFAILVYEDVEPIDIGATCGVLSMARRCLPQISMFVVAAQAGPVRLANGLIIHADHGFADCPPADVLVVTGGPGWTKQRADAAMLAFVKNFHPASILASICTGGTILAAAGLLDGLRATTRARGIPGELTPLEFIRREHPKLQAVDALVVDAGPVVTGGGVTLGIDTMLHLLARLFGRQAAEQVAQMMEYSRAWKANTEALPSYVE